MEHSFHGDLSKNEFYGVIEEATQKWFSWLGGPILQCQQKDARAEVYLGQNEDCSLEESTSDSSEKLLQRGSRGRSIYKILVKGEFNASTFILLKVFC